MTTTTHERDLVAARLTGSRIHGLLWDRRISQASAAEMAGVSQSTFSKKLRGLVPLTVDELMAIAGLLDMQPGDLLPSVEDLRARRDSNPKPSDLEPGVVLLPWRRVNRGLTVNRTRAVALARGRVAA